MKTFTIGWLNKCRCGNKSHSVKTARGNESALWDDDAVKCNSCGRGGVIQVCEGQARVLWETDEEMAEGKPMSTITKERIANLLQFNSEGSNCQANAEQWEVHELARIALASLEAEPVALRDERSGSGGTSKKPGFNDLPHGAPLYTAHPAPVSVPDELKEFLRLVECMLIDYRESNLGNAREWIRHISSASDAFEDAHSLSPWLWVRSACRAAMLHGAEPVTTAYKLRDAVEVIRNSGIAIDAEKIFAERDALNASDCWCRTCRQVTISDMRFVVCPECGNKRCPHANDHRNACTGSNEPGQQGSAYPAGLQQEVK
ncbi:TPA: hypothetical protein ACNIB8_000880 [Enterobacter hormaechei]|nr:hypothetical protein [Enterobacter hormaechei subsp. steigerwaltii]